MDLPQDSKQLLQWLQERSGRLFKFLSLFKRLASMPFPSFLQHILTCKVLMTANRDFDVRHSAIVGCDDQVVYVAENNCIPLVFLTCITCLIIYFILHRMLRNTLPLI